MSKKKTPQQSQSSLEFQVSSIWDETFARAYRAYPDIMEKFLDFKNFKENTPLADFGAKDRQFISTGTYAKYLPKARKCTIARDLSIVYELAGSPPTRIMKLYGIFTHSELGMKDGGTNIAQQKSMAKRLSGSFDEGIDEGYWWEKDNEEPEPNPPPPRRLITTDELADIHLVTNGQYQVGELKSDHTIIQDGKPVGIIPAGTRGLCRWPDNSTNTRHMEFEFPRSVIVKNVIPAVKKANQVHNVFTDNIKFIGRVDL